LQQEVDVAEAMVERKNVVYEEIQKMVIEGPILDVVHSMVDADKELVGNNSLLRNNVAERVKLEVKAEVLEDFIDEAAEINLPKLREVVSKNKEAVYSLIASQDDPLRCLDLARKVRSCHRGMNAVTKKKSILEKGTTTLSKIMRLSEGFVDVFLIGARNHKHRMAHHPEVRRVCDVWGEGGFYENLDVRDWKGFTEGYRDLIIDVSIAGEDHGMCVPESYERMYVDMAAAGKRVLAKVDKFGYIMKNGYFTDFMSYRDHNRETFALVSAVKGEGHDFSADVVDANVFRMAYLLDYNYPFEKTVKSLPDDLVLNSVRKKKKTAHEYDGSVIEQLVPDVDYEVGSFYNNKDYVFTDNDYEWIYGEVELPCVIQDVDFWTTDSRRLLESFNKFYELVYEDDLGWIAVAEK